MNQTLTKQLGEISDIPHRSDRPKCQNLLPEDVRRALDYEEINYVRPTAGRCRFCGYQFDVTHVRVPGIPGDEIGVFQCDKATMLWERAEQLKRDRLAKAIRENAEISEKGKGKSASDYF